MLLLPEVLTVREARDALRMLSQALQRERDGPVQVDASGLRRFDSSALAVLIDCRRQAQALRRDFEVRQPPGQLADLARLYGVGDLLWREGSPEATAPAERSASPAGSA